MLVVVVGFASLEPPDKQWASTVYPTGNLLGKFSPNSNPTLTFHNKKKNTNHLVSVLFLVALKLSNLIMLRLHYLNPQYIVVLYKYSVRE